MNDRTLLLILYLATPVTLIVGLTVMYLIIGDHPWFTSMAIGYTVLLALLFLVKITLFRKFMKPSPPRETESVDS
jgi:membrane protein implicated in regulation of membrane protease activity